MLLTRDANMTQKEIFEIKSLKEIYKTDSNRKTSSMTTLHQTK